MAESWSILRVLSWTTGRFERAGVGSPRLDAQVLIAHALQCDRMSLYTGFDRPLSPEELAACRELIQRRLDGAPVAYLVGEQEFWSLAFKVSPDVLVPRRDTETLIEVVMDEVKAEGDASRPLFGIEIATGSGAVAVTLATELAGTRLIATDISEPALSIAAENVARHGVADRVELRCGDLFAPLQGVESADFVVANLPYVNADDIEQLSPEVRSEPRLALDGGPDGLDTIRRLMGAVGSYVRPGGFVALEHGDVQGAAVRALATEHGFANPTTRRDLGDRDRVTVFRKS